MPAAVPALVSAGYDTDVNLLPEHWLVAARTAHADWESRQALRAANARQYLLSTLEDLGAATLDGLHSRHTAELDDEGPVLELRRVFQEVAPLFRATGLEALP